MILSLIAYVVMQSGCEARLKNFTERHIIADSPYTYEQEEDYFRRLDAIEKLYEQRKDGK